jgi:hypothetical protein
MKRKLLVFIITFLVGKSILSQVTHSITIGPDLGLGANFGKSSKGSIGGSLEYVAQLSEKIGIRLSGGYNKFNGRYYDDYVSFLPIRIGVQAFVFEELIFAFTEAGIAKYKASSGTEKTGPSLSFGAGYRQPLSGRQFIQTSVYFNYYKYKGDPPGGDLNYTWFNFRIAYGFSFGNTRKSKEE